MGSRPSAHSSSGHGHAHTGYGVVGSGSLSPVKESALSREPTRAAER